nr:tetratricopeptide repeat protein [Myxococcota bacterium]
MRALGVLLALGAALAFVQPASAQTQPSSKVEFYELTDRGLEHFRAERYAAALEAFDQALAASNEGADAVSVAFNAAACAFALGRFDDAERRFLAVAARPGGTPLATLNAGFAALY